jgi:hypothetical protein
MVRRDFSDRALGKRRCRSLARIKPIGLEPLVRDSVLVPPVWLNHQRVVPLSNGRRAASSLDRTNARELVG